MWWLLLVLSWWCGTSAVPAPDPWVCPQISEPPIVECSCDMPHTLRCTGNWSALQIIGQKLRTLKTASVSLLDCTVQNVSTLPGSLLEGVGLHGLVISSGNIREIHASAFQGLSAPLQALGLPNNQLNTIPIQALRSLPELDRLDLSNNKLKSLEEDNFQGLQNLSFIELSGNLISKISPATFSNLPQLKVLRLRGNKLKITTISSLNLMPRNLEEIDLSNNELIGPISEETFPNLPNLRDLNLAHNSFSSIKKAALQNFIKLSSLSLHHNQIDVLEDYAFKNLTNLISLDLGHNRIVAISGASLANLVNLRDLDMRHNFLRALTADLIIPLKNLKNLRLDDNDISIISTDALRNSTILERLTLSENPLNCDCSLSEFAIWLSRSNLTKEDKASAVCTTPPDLENGLLIDVPIKNLLCGIDERDQENQDQGFLTQNQDSLNQNTNPIKGKIVLRKYYYDGSQVVLQWSVEDKALPYACDALYLYEEEGENEILLESSPLKCNSTVMENPQVLNVTVPNSTELQLGHRYRYCVVLLQAGGQSDELSLVLGCSDVIPLVQNSQQTRIQQQQQQKLPKVVAIQANLTSYGNLIIDVNIAPILYCEINLAILEQGSLLSQKRINCTDPKYTFIGLQDGPYRVCANIVNPSSSTNNNSVKFNVNSDKPRCVTVFKREMRGFSGLDVAFVSIFLVLSFVVIGLIWGVRRVLLKPKLQTHQCFMPPDMEDAQQHNRYVKLQATTKL